MVRFVAFAKQWIHKHLKPNPNVNYKRRVELIEEAQELLMKSSKNAATKNRIHKKL